MLELRPLTAGEEHLFLSFEDPALVGFQSIGRDYREAQESKVRDSHAAIRYGSENDKVGELPASMVYEQGQR